MWIALILLYTQLDYSVTAIANYLFGILQINNYFLSSCFQQARSDSYRYAVTPKGEEAAAGADKGKKGKKDKAAELDDLKQELEMVSTIYSVWF